MTMRDKVAQIISDKYQYGDDSLADTADAILAALPDMIAPLVFMRHPIGWSTDGFMIDTRGTNTWVLRGLYGNPRFDTVEDAIKACNANHRSVIMAAFTQ